MYFTIPVLIIIAICICQYLNELSLEVKAKDYEAKRKLIELSQKSSIEYEYGDRVYYRTPDGYLISTKRRV